MEKSNLDVAYEIMQKRTTSISFADLWKEVCSIQGFSEEFAESKVGKFYTNLFMDGRFITLGENVWDLRDRYTFDRVHIDMNDVYHDDDEEESEEEEDMDEELEDSGEDDLEEEKDSSEENLYKEQKEEY